MSHIYKRGWNRVVLAERIGGPDGHGGTITEAEFYLAAGKIVRRRICRGSRPESIARSLGISTLEALDALRYAESSPATVFRALVENWRWQRIKAHLDKQARIDEPAAPRG